MPVTLNDAEREVLRRVIDNYLPELRFELVRAEDREVQRDLARLEEMLEQIRRRL